MTVHAEDEDVPVTNSGSGSQEFNLEAVTEVSSMIPRNSNANTTRTQQQRRMRILTSQENSKSNQDTFEESFSKHRHAGSFRLRYSRDEFASEANVDNVVAPNQSLKSANDSKDTDIRIHELYFHDSDSNSEVLVKPEDELPQEVGQEQSTVKISKDSKNKTKQILRVLSSQGSDNCNADTFEDAFSKHRYAGSFRLRFGTCRDEVASLANRVSDNSADTTESLTLDLQDEIDIEELAIDLPPPATLPGKKTTTNPESKVLEVEEEKGPVDLMTTDSELYVNDMAVQENVNTR